MKGLRRLLATQLAASAPFSDEAVMPFLRKEMGGHGQGARVISIPTAYGELSVRRRDSFGRVASLSSSC